MEVKTNVGSIAGAEFPKPDVSLINEHTLDKISRAILSMHRHVLSMPNGAELLTKEIKKYERSKT